MSKENNTKEKNVPLYGVVDERTKAIAIQGDSYTAKFMLFAVLVDVMLRSLDILDSFTDSNWDLILIVIIGGFISTFYQVKNKIMFQRPFVRSFIYILLLLVLSGSVAFILIKLMN